MRTREIVFVKPVKILQVFRHIHIYGKAQKSFQDRKETMAWHDILSKAGYVKDGELFLPETILENPDFKTCDLITMEDDLVPKEFSETEITVQRVMPPKNEPQYNGCFYLARQNKLDIFEIRKADPAELFLNYSYFEVGIPERPNIKLCDIKPNSPVEIKINGKTDQSLSSRRARVFKEQHYIFDFLGEFPGCKILDHHSQPIQKTIPADRKVVNMLKPLW